ncbi:MAG: hypothetical protein LBT40_08955 [Deltaproteobacteria bacterium]|nr:hypothetical protein [Deltaproteobacteria bacterium]
MAAPSLEDGRPEPGGWPPRAWRMAALTWRMAALTWRMAALTWRMAALTWRMAAPASGPPS